MVNNITKIVSVIILLITSLFTNTIVMAAGDGLNAYYWNFAVVDNNNQFPSGNPNLNRIEAVVDNDWQRGSPANSINADKFAVRWQGSIEINETGKYVFHTLSDDGIRLWINNQLIVNNWTLHGARWNNSASIDLIADTRYDIKMEFFEHTGRAVARLHWQTPSNSTRHVIPQSQLYSDTAEKAQLVAKYDFNENWQDTGEIIDQIGTASGRLSGRVHKVISGANGLKPDTCSAAQFSGGAIDINSLPISTAPGDKTSLSFWMFWNGNDSVMPLGWRLHDLWLVNGNFGFNTAGSDIYGIANTGWLKNSWHHVTAVFTNGDVFDNKLYIDGKEQTLSHVQGRIQNSNALVDPHLRLGGWWANNGYRFQGQLDELRIYTGEIEQSTINDNLLAASPEPCFADEDETEQLVAKYDFNENWQDTDEIIDRVGTASGSVSGSIDKVTSGANGLKPDTCSAAQFSGGAIDINSLPISTAPGNKTSLSFWMFWNGNNSAMPLGWRLHDLWLVNGNFGFNTAGSDIYGIANTGWLKNSWHHVTAVFTNGNVFDNKLYIDGVEQTLSHVQGTIQNSNALVDPHLRLGGWWANNGYRFQGQLDELRIYTGKIAQSTIDANRLAASPCDSDLHHFQFEYARSALTCQSSPIIVKACGNADCSSLYTEDVTLTLSPNNGWSTNPVTLSDGLVELKLSHHSVGSVGLDIASTSVPPISTLQCYGDNSIDPSCLINFADAGFVFDVPTLTACKPSADVIIKAVKKSDTSVQCVGALTGNQTLNFWSSYLSPTTGSKQNLISGTKIKQSSPGTPVNITFNNEGVATFTVQYDDAGQLQLDASFDNGNGLTLKGHDVFVSKPENLITYSDDANAGCASLNANCSKFKKAGESFNLKVNAACWTHDGDTDFTDNPITPNFELSSIVNTHNLLAPASGSTGTISNTSFNFTTSDNGSHTVSQTVSEVGVFEFGTTAPNYFGETLTTVASPAIGRFYPDHFELSTQSNGSFGAHACTGFSYSGQRFSYQTSPQLTVSAYSALNPATITQNYTGDFAKLTISDFSVTTPTSDANQLGADATNRVRLLWTADAPDLTDNANGTLTFAFGHDSYSYLHQPNSKIDEFINAVNLTFTAISDSDNVDADDLPYTLQPTGEPIRFGRFAINSAHGSELAPLALNLTAEYFNGINWVDNSADQCTTLSLASDLQLTNPQTAGGSWQAGNSTMTIANGTTSGLLTNNAPLLNGTATLTLSAPGEDNEGYVDLRSQLSITAPWLLGDYDNDGHYDDNPTGRASFGLFKGSDNIIFRRELY